VTKPTWVFVAGTYRSGSTTHYHMVRDVVQVAGAGIAIGYHNERRLKEFDRLDFGDLEAIRSLYAHHEIECPFEEPPTFTRPSPYIVCKVFEYLPGGFRGQTSHGQLLGRQGRIRAIISVRDPRDIATSMKRREEQRSDAGRHDGEPFDFEKLVTERFPIWLGWLTRWADMGPQACMISRFELFTRDRQGEVLRIAAHLGLDISRADVRRIADDYSVDQIRQRKDGYWQRRRETPGLREDPALPSVPALLFAKSGHWRDELSAEEADLVYESNRAFFERFGYER